MVKPPNALRRNARRLAEYLTVGEAAEFLGVSPWTLRNWDKAGKLKPSRHPKNGYRIYRHEDLKTILDSTPTGGRPSSGLTPQIDWNHIDPAEHLVLFYEKDSFLISSASRFIGAALQAGDAGLIVVTQPHRNAIQKRLQRQGLDLSAAINDGRLIMLDAADAIDQVVVDGTLDEVRLTKLIDGMIPLLIRDGQKLRVCGEIAGLLLAAGHRSAGIRLEQIWDEAAKKYSFALLCAYPMKGFADLHDADPFADVCKCHSRIIPAEGYSELSNPEDQLRQISALQQKAASLKAEIAHRHKLEVSLQQANNIVDTATREKHRFLSALSSDLRTTLRPALLTASRIEADPALPSHLRDQLTLIRQAIVSELQFIDDLLAAERQHRPANFAN